MTLPSGCEVRNTMTRLDDHGLAHGLPRHDGESLVNYKYRLIKHMAGLPRTDIAGLTNALANEFGIGQNAVARLTTDRDLKFEVKNTDLIISGSSQYVVYQLIQPDIDGYWTYPTISGMVDYINANVSGVSAIVLNSSYDQMAMLLENQSSYKEFLEVIPRQKQYKVGQFTNHNLNNVTFITERTGFLNSETFHTQVSTSPSAEGEWYFNASGLVKFYNIPQFSPTIKAVYNTFISGRSIDLVARGVKPLSLVADNVQDLMFEASGIQETKREFLKELGSYDRLTWG